MEQIRSNISVPMAALIGDTTGHGTVNSSDNCQTQSQSGQAVISSNFREDVTVLRYQLSSIEAGNGLALSDWCQTLPVRTVGSIGKESNGHVHRVLLFRIMNQNDFGNERDRPKEN